MITEYLYDRVLLSYSALQPIVPDPHTPSPSGISCTCCILFCSYLYGVRFGAVNYRYCVVVCRYDVASMMKKPVAILRVCVCVCAVGLQANEVSI